jgi:hypothetical protein
MLPLPPSVRGIGKQTSITESIPCREAPALAGSFNALLQINLAILAGFSSQEDLLSPTPSERFPVSHWVTFGQYKK